jgi:hypothetical protein
MGRIKEPSTWAGISGSLAALSTLQAPIAQPWLIGLSSFSGAIAIYLREASTEVSNGQ